ncbi:MAG: acyl-CoA dehydrogenase family protein [Actinobacteria bacterium]|nr:acyl-CoA dehydrogenase family protein [Actinomycetota bacterium]
MGTDLPVVDHPGHARGGESQVEAGIYALPEEYVELQSAVRALARDKIAPRAAEIDAKGEFPWDVYDALVASGFHAIHIPEEYDGMGGDNLASALVVEEIARVCGSSSLIPAVNKLGTTPLLVGASHEVKARYLPEVASGEAMFSYGLSEPEAGSDAASMRTKVTRDGDDWILNGNKRWITGAGISKYYTVLATADPGTGPKGITAFVVHADDEGFTLGAEENKLGIKGSPTRELYFDNVRLPADRMIGEVGEGWKIAMKTLDITRVTIGAQAVGMAQGALDVALEYAQERKQFGKAISDFQGIQFMLADMAMQIEAARQLVYHAAAASDRGDANVTFLGSAAKCFASDTAMKVAVDVVQVLGGYGYVKDYPAERFMRDAKITQIYEGTNQIQRLVIARQILG